MVMRTDSALTSAPQGLKMAKRAAPAPAAPVAHHQAVGNAAFAGMRHLATGGGQQAVISHDTFFGAQEDFTPRSPEGQGLAGASTPRKAR